jgi:pimeloyl-ACP methyl ester carboxylesterase
VTQRGHGDAERPDRGYGTHEFAADIAALVDAFDLGPVIVAGHSMGSFHALRFAIDHSEITLGLVLAGCSASWGANPAFAEFWKTVVLQLRDPIDPVLVREFQQSTVARPVPRSLIDTAVQESLKVPARVWRDSFAGFMERDCTEELAAVRAPTLLVWGDRDTLALRRDQDALLAGIARARLFVYEGGGHAVHWEQPQRFAADLADFARNVAKTRSAALAMAI